MQPSAAKFADPWRLKPGIVPADIPTRRSGKKFFRLLALCLLVSAGSQAIFSQDGGARAGYEYRSFDRMQKRFENDFHLDLWQNLGNNGVLSLWVDWIRGETPEPTNRAGRVSLTLSGFKLRNALVDVTAGDSAVLFTNLQERFSNAAYPDIYLRGLQAHFRSQSARLTFFGGKVALLDGLLGKTYSITDETLIGMTGNLRLLPRFLVGTGFIRTQDEKNSSGQPVSRSNSIFLFDAEIAMTGWLKWLGEFKSSDSRQETGLSTTGYMVKLGPYVQTKNFKLEMNYHDSGDAFHFVHEAFQTERGLKGLFLLAQLNLWDRLNLFGNFDGFDSRIAEAEGQNGTRSRRGMVGLSFFSPRTPSFYLYYDRMDQKERVESPTDDATFISSLFSEIRYPFRGTDPYLRYRRSEFRTPSVSGTGQIQNVLTVGWRQLFRPALQGYIEGEISRTDETGGERETISTGKMGFNFSGFQRWSCWGEGGVSVRQTPETTSRKPLLSGSFGMIYQFPRGVQLFMDIRYDQFERFQMLETGNLPLSGFQVSLRISKSFNWGRGGTIPAAYLAGERETEGYGTVEGTVFNDRNQNGYQDSGEEGIRKTAFLRLENGSTASTDGQGRYRFARVAAGQHLLTFDTRKIPADYAIVSPEKIRIDVRLRGTAKADFQVIATGRISGRVILDANGNGKIDPGENGTPDALLFLHPGESNTYTDENGNFEFDNVLPGECVLKLDAASLPEGAEPMSPLDVKLSLAVGETISDVCFLVHVKPPPVLIRKITKK